MTGRRVNRHAHLAYNTRAGSGVHRQKQIQFFSTIDSWPFPPPSPSMSQPPSSSFSSSSDPRDKYVNPLTTRYAGSAMSRVWSDSVKFQTWRKLWLALVRLFVCLFVCLSGPQSGVLLAFTDRVVKAQCGLTASSLRRSVSAFGPFCLDKLLR